jgi:hypothetical protein
MTVHKRGHPLGSLDHLNTEIGSWSPRAKGSPRLARSLAGLKAPLSRPSGLQVYEAQFLCARYARAQSSARNFVSPYSSAGIHDPGVIATTSSCFNLLAKTSPSFIAPLSVYIKPFVLRTCACPDPAHRSISEAHTSRSVIATVSGSVDALSCRLALRAHIYHDSRRAHASTGAPHPIPIRFNFSPAPVWPLKFCLPPQSR